VSVFSRCRDTKYQMVRKRKAKRRKSAKRVARGKKLARTLPRDAKGKFLPRGSKNLFRKKPKTRKRRLSVGKQRRSTPKKKRTLRRTKSSPSMGSRRGLKTVDLFPNFLSGDLIGAAGAGFATKQIFTPIPRLRTIGNRATVMELLYMDVDTNFNFGQADGEYTFQASTGSAPTAVQSWADPRVFVLIKQSSEGLPVAFIPTLKPWRFQFQTLDGFGYLLASDSFNVTFAALNQAVAPNVTITTFKLYYRFVDIPLAEFIGIVQSTAQT